MSAKTTIFLPSPVNEYSKSSVARTDVGLELYVSSMIIRPFFA